MNQQAREWTTEEEKKLLGYWIDNPDMGDKNISKLIHDDFGRSVHALQHRFSKLRKYGKENPEEFIRKYGFTKNEFKHYIRSGDKNNTPPTLSGFTLVEIEDDKEKPPNHGNGYTDREKEYIASRITNNPDVMKKTMIKELAEELGRTPKAINDEVYRIDLEERAVPQCGNQNGNFMRWTDFEDQKLAELRINNLNQNLNQFSDSVVDEFPERSRSSLYSRINNIVQGQANNHGLDSSTVSKLSEIDGKDEEQSEDNSEENKSPERESEPQEEIPMSASLDREGQRYNHFENAFLALSMITAEEENREPDWDFIATALGRPASGIIRHHKRVRDHLDYEFWKENVNILKSVLKDVTFTDKNKSPQPEPQPKPDDYEEETGGFMRRLKVASFVFLSLASVGNLSLVGYIFFVI